ncbi:glutathione S-transferase family protein [Marinobacter salarius]|uniref:glutathione S-transferase family protein n=1 Tax=Marinobacter salarius TaxID=1420917 RepID=UPI0032EF4E8E
MRKIKLYRHALSGHSHRAELLLSLLQLDHELVDVDLVNGEHKQPPFLALNRFGQVPVLEDGDTVLADSNAILVYLATRYDSSGKWLPREPDRAAGVQRFLSVAAGPVANGPAAARLVTVFGADKDQQAAIGDAHKLLEVLECHLTGREWLVGEYPSIADIANYSYIAHAPEGGVSLNAYGNVRAWLTRIQKLPGFVAMQATPVGLAA